MILQNNNIDYTKIQPIIDLHECLQGEGKLTGYPHILIRLSGCRLRCSFKDSICDTPYSSYNAEHGKYTLQDLKNLCENNSSIKYAMITGGEPMIHSTLLQNLCDILHSYNMYVTIETCGSDYVKTNADLISLSPKLNNSTPKLSNSINQEMINRHENFRKNYSAMKLLIQNQNDNNKDYQLKFVISDIKDIEEIKNIQNILEVPNNFVFLMPEGIYVEQIMEGQKKLYDICMKEKYNLSDRLHIRMFGNQREV